MLQEENSYIDLLINKICRGYYWSVEGWNETHEKYELEGNAARKKIIELINRNKEIEFIEPNKDQIEQFISDNWHKDFFIIKVKSYFDEEIQDYLDAQQQSRFEDTGV